MAFRENVDFGVVRVRDLRVNGKDMPVQATFAIAAGSSNVTNVTITLKDYLGAAIDNAAVVDLWLSDASTGLGLTGTSASGTPAPTTGTVLVIYSAKKAWRVISNANGSIVLEITDTSKTGFYVAVAMNGFILNISRQLVTADYG